MAILGFVLTFIGIIKAIIIITLRFSDIKSIAPIDISIAEIKGIIGFEVAEILLEIICGSYILCQFT